MVEIGGFILDPTPIDLGMMMGCLLLISAAVAASWLSNTVSMLCSPPPNLDWAPNSLACGTVNDPDEVPSVVGTKLVYSHLHT